MSKSRQILDNYQDRLIRKEIGYEEEESDNDDELLDSLDDEFDSYREQRMQELSRQFKESKKNVQQEGHGRVQTLLSEEDVLKTTTKTRYIVLHFFHENFDKCKKMDEKLEILAQKNVSTKFIRIKVDDAPFLVTRLQIKVLPAVILYINGVESNRIVGFEKLNYDASKDDFDIKSLENYLLANGVIERKANNYQRIVKEKLQEDEESDLDL